jgi:hypothetical protein
MATVSFIDLAGERHALDLTSEQQRELTSAGSQRRQQQLLEGWGLLGSAAAEAPADAAPAAEPAPASSGAAEAALALATMQARIEQVQQQVASYATTEELGGLQQQLSSWSAQAARVSLAHAELAALADQTVARCEAIGAVAQERLDRLADEQATALGAISSELTTAKAAVAVAVSDADRRVAALERQVASDPAFRGPQGNQGERGLAGSGVAYCDVDPTTADPASFGERFYGRGLVPGDLAYLRTPDALQVFRTADGRTWRQIDEVLNRLEMRDIKASVLDASTKAYPTVAAAAGGGGSGTGGEPLLVNRAALSTGVMIADSSNWAGVSDPTSGQLVIEIVALDGSLAGRRGFACIDFTWQPSGAQDSQAGILGDLAGVFDLNLTYQRVAASAPAGLGISMPAATQALQVFATVVPDPGGGGVGGVTQFRISGDLEWAHQSLGQAVPLNSATGIKPLWRWV